MIDEVASPQAEITALKEELNRYKSLNHFELLAEAAGKYLVQHDIKNYFGHVFGLKLDASGEHLEVVVTTRKVGAKSPHDMHEEAEAECRRLRILLAEHHEASQQAAGCESNLQRLLEHAQAGTISSAESIKMIQEAIRGIRLAASFAVTPLIQPDQRLPLT